MDVSAAIADVLASRHLPLAWLCGDLGPDTFMREHFEKYGMRNSAIDDMGFADASSERIQAGMDLGQHPFADRALLHHPLYVLA